MNENTNYAEFESMDMGANIQLFENRLRSMLDGFKAATNSEIYNIDLYHQYINATTPRKLIVNLLVKKVED